jgi:hypothetical protein
MGLLRWAGAGLAASYCTLEWSSSYSRRNRRDESPPASYEQVALSSNMKGMGELAGMRSLDLELISNGYMGGVYLVFEPRLLPGYRQAHSYFPTPHVRG